MDFKKTVWVKKEEMDEFFEDPLGIGKPSINIKEEPELDLEASEHNFLEDPLGFGKPSITIKEEPELDLEAFEHYIDAYSEFPIPESDSLQIKNEEIDTCGEFPIPKSEHLRIKNEEEVTQKRCTGASIRLIKSTSVSASIILEEKSLEAITLDELQIAAGKSTHFFGNDSPTQLLPSQKDTSLYTTNNCFPMETEHLDLFCSSCNRRFSSKYELTMHVFTHISEVEPPEHTCTWCGKVFLTNSSLSEHCMTQHMYSQDIYQCHRIQAFSGDSNINLNSSDNCGKHYTQSGHFTKQTIVYSRDRPCVYDVCEKSFTKSNNSGKQTGQRPHKCNICGKAFVRFSHLDMHTNIHTGQRPHRCNICGKTFIQSSHLKLHTRAHTGEKPFECDICGKLFARKDVFMKHAISHSGERPHKCDVCGKSFSHNGILKSHKLIHTGERPHKCNDCGKSFRWSYHLKLHTFVHTGERPYKCDICGKSFIRYYRLMRHTTKHTPETARKCSICGKIFTTPGYLEKHKCLHPGKTALKCDVCGKFFVKPRNFEKHKLIH